MPKNTPAKRRRSAERAPIQVHLTAEERSALDRLTRESGLSRAEVLRRERGGGAAGPVASRQMGARCAGGYDPATNTWRRMRDMPTPRHGMGAVTVGSFIYVGRRRSVGASGPRARTRHRTPLLVVA
jgi:hypothetical protein